MTEAQSPERSFSSSSSSPPPIAKSGNKSAASNEAITKIAFYSFCFGVPMFMAFNGGATAATVDTIQKEGDWSATGLGLLGAMDKIGMTVSAAFWGYVLQRAKTKMLLVLGLAINTGSVLLFGFIDHWTAMYAAKLMIGFTEGLQWVWVPLWIARWADQESLSLWMNLSGGVAAGVGSGLGIVVAGFSTAQGMSYSFAFKFEGCVLLLFWLELLLVDSDRLSIGFDNGHAQRLDNPKELKARLRTWSEDFEQAAPTKLYRRRHSYSLDSIDFDNEINISEQLESLWKNTLFMKAALAYSSTNFVVSGLQFMWIRLYVTLWPMPKGVAVTSFLLICASAGAIGVALGSSQEAGADRDRGPALVFIWRALASASCAAGLCVVALILQLSVLNLDYAGSFLLLFSWVCLFAVLVGVGATPGLLQIVCTQSVKSDSLRSLATGLYQSVNNFLGFAMGPFLPQVVIDVLDQKLNLEFSSALVAGVTTTLAAVVLGFILSGLAVKASQDSGTYTPFGGVIREETETPSE